MLYEEYKNGTGNESSEEYDLANELYTAMPDTFTKDKMYDLRNAMDKDDFKALCLLATKNQDKLEECNKTINRLEDYQMFTNVMIRTLKTECNLDVVNTYISYMADKASKAEKERLTSKWNGIGEKG